MYFGMSTTIREEKRRVPGPTWESQKEVGSQKNATYKFIFLAPLISTPSRIVLPLYCV